MNYRAGNNGRAAAILLITMSLLSCSSDGGTAPNSEGLLLSLDGPAEYSPIQQIGQHLAVALASPGVRNALREDMARSRNREHKLHFTSYVSSARGSTLIKHLLASAGRDSMALMGAIHQTNLEIYLPVRDQRERWTGEETVIVAVQSRDGERPTGFNPDGSSVYLSLSEPPSVPTIVLVPVETDFSRTMDTSAVVNIAQVPGAVGTLVKCTATVSCPPGSGHIASITCDPEDIFCDDDPPGGVAPSPAGIYLSMAQISDLRESWPRGEPEIEVFLVGPGDYQNSMELYGCAHEGQTGYRYYNQDNTTWYGELDGGNDVLVADSADVEALRQAYPDTSRSTHAMAVLFLEDDYNRCEVHDDDDEYAALINNIFWSALMTAGIIVLHDWGPGSDLQFFWVAVSIPIIFNWSYHAAQDDDLIGVAEHAAEWNDREGGSVLRTHAIHRGGVLRGEANIYLRPKGYYQ